MHFGVVAFASPSGGYLRRLSVGILNRLGVFILHLPCLHSKTANL